MTTDQLLDAARRAGLSLTPHALKRWRREGLLRRPEQIHRAGIEGSAARYPPGTLGQLLKVAELRRRERRFDELRFDTWWHDGWVEAGALRRSLMHVLDEPLKEIRAIRRQHTDPFDAAHAVVMASDASRGRSPVTRLLRRRAGSGDDVASAMVPVLVLAFGGEPIWHTQDVGLDEKEADPIELVRRVIGLERASTDALEGDEPWLTELPDVVGDLELLRDSGLLELERPSELIAGTPEGELDRARRLARTLADEMPLFARALELRFDRDAGGFGVFQVTSGRDARWFRAYFVRFCVLLPRLVSPENVRATLSALSAARPGMEAVIAIGNRFPGYKPFLGPMGREHLERLPAEEQEQVAANVRALLAEKPGLEASLNAMSEQRE